MEDELWQQLPEVVRLIDEQWQRIDDAQVDHDAKDEQTKAAAKELGEVESEFLAFAYANGNDRVIRLRSENERAFADVQERRSAAWSSNPSGSPIARTVAIVGGP